MKIKLLNDHPEKTFAIVLEKEEEVMRGLMRAAEDLDLTCARLTGIGAFEKATLGYFQRDRKEYKELRVTEQVEVLSLTGDIALSEGRPKLHVHVVLGSDDGSAKGGHLLEATVWPTLEVILVESPQHLRRRFDPETKLPLIDLNV